MYHYVRYVQSCPGPFGFRILHVVLHVNGCNSCVERSGICHIYTSRVALLTLRQSSENILGLAVKDIWTEMYVRI